MTNDASKEITTKCFNCSCDFTLRKSIYDNRRKRNDSGRMFCSMKCVYECFGKERSIKRQKCDICGNDIKNLKSKSKTCSLDCAMQYRYITYISDWKQGIVIPMLNGCVSSYIRRYLLEECDNKCSQCGWAEKNPHTNKIPLEVDHIDGNAENNLENNLRVLCPNCHSLTSTYKALNTGNGRKGRRKQAIMPPWLSGRASDL